MDSRESSTGGIGRQTITSTCQLQLRLVSGSGLAVRDLTGSSDPYVVFRTADRQLGRSRVVHQSLEPVWNEEFQFTLDSPVEGDLELRVYDWDALSPRDDYMGRCLLPLAALSPGNLHSFRLPLADETRVGGNTSIGDIRFTARLMPPSPVVEKSPQPLPQQPRAELPRPPPILAVRLVDIVGLPAEVSQLALYAQLRLGDRTCRSRVARRGQSWDEELRLPLSPPLSEQLQPVLHLEIYERHLTSRDVLIGRVAIPLTAHGAAFADNSDGSSSGDLLVAPLVDHPLGGPAVRLLIGIADTGDIGEDGVNDDVSSVGAVGSLRVRVLAVEGLRTNNGATVYCTLRLGNSQLCAGVGGRQLRFRVLDLHSELELAVYEDGRRPRLIGRLAVRLTQLEQQPDGWYGLRDKHLEQWTGARVHLGCQLYCSYLWAALRSIGPPEPRLWGRPEPKLHLRMVRRDAKRCAAAAEAIGRVGAFAASCYTWEDPARSACTLVCYVAIVWNLQLYMLPMAPLALLLAGLAMRLLDGGGASDCNDGSEVGLAGGDGDDAAASSDSDEADDEADADGGVGQSWLERARAAQDLLLRMQDGLDAAASAYERLRHLGRWTEPRISCLVAVLLASAALILCLLPLRLLALAWGLNKFTKRLLRPEADDSNEVLNLLSRVPCDVDLERTRPMPPQPQPTSATYAQPTTVR